MPLRPKCFDCGNDNEFREYELVSYIATYHKLDNGSWEKDSETESYSDFPDELYTPQCLACGSEYVEYVND
jgi:hypothetical protein